MQKDQQHFEPQQVHSFSPATCFNSFFSLKLSIQRPQEIYKTSKQIKGVVSLIPKVHMLNIPIQVSILGQSQCTIFTDPQQSLGKVTNSIDQLKSFRIHETQEELAEKKSDIEKCIQSSEFLSDNFVQSTQNKSEQGNHSKKQLFLEGKQNLFQENESKQKIKMLIPNKEYMYPYSFFVPSSIPISIDQKIFPGVFLYVSYKIQAMIEMDQKFFVFNENTCKLIKEEKMKKMVLQNNFKIKRSPRQNISQKIINKFNFNYYHAQGQLIEQNCIDKLFCFRQLYRKFIRKQTRFDFYHGELLVSVNPFNIIHVTGRVFLQPVREKLEGRKIKKGKNYVMSKPSDKSKKQQKKAKINSESIHSRSESYKKNQLTVSKIIQESESIIHIQILKIKMYGQITNVKKILIFQKLLHLNRMNYDMNEGEFIVQLDQNYFSQKNELFQIRFWFQIQPIGQTKPQDKQQSPRKVNQSRELNMTFSKLNEDSKNSWQIKNISNPSDHSIKILDFEINFLDL